MKAKRISVYLSVLTLIQLIFIGTGGAFVNELFEEVLNVRVMLILAIAWTVVAAIGIMIYSDLFTNTPKSRK